MRLSNHMTTTFPDPRVTKADFVRIMREHAAADHLIAGRYGVGERDSFRGCAIGCGVETINRLTGQRHRYDNYDAVANTLGIPLALAYLEDRIFEGLGPEERRTWPVRFAEAIPEEADLWPAVPRILARILRELALPAVTVDEWGVKAAVEAVCRGLETGKGLESARAAARVASAAAFAARGAADTAANTARAAVFAASAVVYAARAVVYAAGAVVYAVACAARVPYPVTYSYIADIVIEEMGR